MRLLAVLSACWLLAGTLQTALAAPPGPRALPRPRHVLIVIEENRAYSQIIGAADAPYINALAKKGALMTRSHAITHPSLPNYLALFAGDTQGVLDDGCNYAFNGPTLASALRAAGLRFATYSEYLPGPGFAGCGFMSYRRKHNPAVYWQKSDPKAAAENVSFSDFPDDYAKLPTVAFVIPNQDHDMHDGTIAQGDAWLKANLDGYVHWALANDSLLIVTWDEDDGSEGNRIATIIVGAPVKPGRYQEPLDHYGLLRTLEDMYGLAPLGHSADAVPLRTIWK
jgi:acid phosphatase